MVDLDVARRDDHVLVHQHVVEALRIAIERERIALGLRFDRRQVDEVRRDEVRAVVGDLERDRARLHRDRLRATVGRDLHRHGLRPRGRRRGERYHGDEGDQHNEENTMHGQPQTAGSRVGDDGEEGAGVALTRGLAGRRT